MPRHTFVLMVRGRDTLWIISTSCEHARQLRLLYEYHAWEAVAQGSIPHHPTLDSLLAKSKRR